MILFAETVDWSSRRILEENWGKHQVKTIEERITADNAASYPDTEILSTFIYSDLTANVLSHFSKLRMISTRSTGFDHIDLNYCRQHNITVTNVPHYGENTVAEHTFGLILTISRNIHKAYQRTSNFNFSIEGLRGFDLYGRTIGVAGAGNIGLHVIRIAKGLGMKVLAFDTKPQKLISEVLGFDYVDFDTLLQRSDIVSLHIPLLEATRHIINRQSISKMKQGAILINTARGGLVDTSALLEALESGHIGGAALDVIEGEEFIMEEAQLLHGESSEESMKAVIQNYRLLKKENVVITPHIGFYSIEAEERILQTTFDNINAFISGNLPEYVL